MIIKEDSLPEIDIPRKDTDSEKIPIPAEPQPRNDTGKKAAKDRHDWRRYLAEAVRKTLKRRETERRAQARCAKLRGAT